MSQSKKKSYPKFHKFEQKSDEWFQIRSGKLTASKADAIASNGKGLETLVYETVASKHSSGEYEHYTNLDMERGNELEENARSIYELEKNCTVEVIGFVEMSKYAGCSPDGLIGEDGGVEIKCHNDAKHLRLLIDEKIDTKYIWQMQMSLYVTGRKWWDYVAYNPNFKKSLIVHRIEPDEEKFAKLEEGIKQGTKLIKQVEKKL